jgi:hypothetical protein
MKKLIMLLFFVCLLFAYFASSVFAENEENVYRVAARLVSVERVPAAKESIKPKSYRQWDDGVLRTTWYTQPRFIILTLSNPGKKEMKIRMKQFKFIKNRKEGSLLVKTPKMVMPEGRKADIRIPAGGTVEVKFFPVVNRQLRRTSAGGSLGGENYMARSSGVETINVFFKQTYGEEDIRKIIKKQGIKNPNDFDLQSYMDKKAFDIALKLAIDGTTYRYRFHFRPFVFQL